MADVANVGLVRPPLVYLCSISLGLLAHWLWPAQFLRAAAGVPAGIAVIVVAGALFFFAVLTFRNAGTPVPGNRPTTAIVRAGPYRFSRNPIYLAFSLLQLGIAIAIDDPWLIVTLVAAVALMATIVIPREERYLETKFGREYLDYKASVRRWI